MGTQKKDLTMRDCKNRYSESDLPSLFHAHHAGILRELLAHRFGPNSCQADQFWHVYAPKLDSTRLFVLDFTKELPYKISSISPPL